MSRAAVKAKIAGSKSGMSTGIGQSCRQIWVGPIRSVRRDACLIYRLCGKMA